MLHLFNGEGYHHDSPKSIGMSSEEQKDGLHSLMMITIIITIIIISEFKTSRFHFLSVTSPLCSMKKYIDIIVSQNTNAQYVQYISQPHVSAHFRPSSGCSLQPSECGSLKTGYVFQMMISHSSLHQLLLCQFSVGRYIWNR